MSQQRREEIKGKISDGSGSGDSDDDDSWVW